jgi:hypothetical protein
MSIFWVYRKGQKEPVVVKADAAALSNNILAFTVGTESIAEFAYSEVQGWQKKVDSSNKSASKLTLPSR